MILLKMKLNMGNTLWDEGSVLNCPTMETPPAAFVEYHVIYSHCCEFFVKILMSTFLSQKY